MTKRYLKDWAYSKIIDYQLNSKAFGSMALSERRSCARRFEVLPVGSVVTLCILNLCEKIAKKCFCARDRCICTTYISQLHRATSLQRRRGQCSPAPQDVCSNGKDPRADMESAPTVRGGDACHPKQITKTKNPRTNVRGFWCG